MPACNELLDRNMSILDNFTIFFVRLFPTFREYTHDRPFSLYYIPCQREVQQRGFEINQAIMLLLGVVVEWQDILLRYVPLFETLPLPSRGVTCFNRITHLFDFYIKELSHIKTDLVGERHAEQLGLFFWDVFNVKESYVEIMQLNSMQTEENSILCMILLMNGSGARLKVRRALRAFMWAKLKVN